MLDSATKTELAEEPRLSVVIRCRNESASLERVFDALAAQRCSFRWEVIVVDNESTDATRSVCDRYGVRVVPIAASEFSYGRAINVGIASARGQLILLLSAHCVPVGSSFLETAVAAFDDPSVAAARCLQASKSEQLAAWYTPKRVQYRTEEEQREAESARDWLTLYPTAGCCILRRSVWECTRFDETLEAVEDKLWASEVLRKGFAIVSCVSCVYVYTRKRTPSQWHRRQLREELALYRITGRPPLSWQRYFLRCIRTVCLTPWAAARYLFGNIAYDTGLAIVPLRSRGRPPKGSPPEFSPPNAAR